MAGAIAWIALLLAQAPAAAPPETPVWEARKVDPDAAEVKAQRYRVRPGDTLSAIVHRTGAGADAIARANALQPPYRLVVGKTIAIPAGRYHRVGRGESGIAIARAYGVEWSAIAALNHLSEPFVLREGDRLLLPPAKAVADMSMEQRAAAFRIDLGDLVTGSAPALAPKARPVAPKVAPTAPVAPTVPVADPAKPFVGRFGWPVTGRIIRPYGPLASGGRNDGINIAAPKDTPIHAAADGVVAYAAAYPAFGQVVLIRHGSSWVTLYAHADQLLVKRGQAVTRGQVIARVGTTGSVTEPQLHFEIRGGQHAKPLNPLDYLPAQ